MNKVSDCVLEIRILSKTQADTDEKIFIDIELLLGNVYDREDEEDQ